MKLLKWQLQMVQIIRAKNYLWLDSPTGLGKSVLARSLVIAAKSGLIICPPHLLNEYKADFIANGIEPVVLGSTNNKITQDGVYLMSTNKMALYGLKVTTMLAILVCDELHRWKSHKTELWKNTMMIRNWFYYKLGMTATMAPKNTADLAPMALLLVDKVNSQYNGSWYKYAAENIMMKKAWFGTKSIDVPVSLHKHALEEVRTNYLTFVTYQSAGLEVPEMVEKDVEFDIDSEYDDKMEDVEIPIDGDVENIMGYRFSDFVQLSNCFIYKDADKETKAKEYCMKEKKEALKSVIESEEGQGVVFYWYKHSLASLKAFFKNDYMMYESGMDLNLFRDSGKKILIANYKSMGEGTRVKSADFIVNFDLIYDAGLVEQARGRLRYVGRPTPYRIYNLIPNHDGPKKIVRNIKSKINTMNKLKTEV